MITVKTLYNNTLYRNKLLIVIKSFSPNLELVINKNKLHNVISHIFFKSRIKDLYLYIRINDQYIIKIFIYYIFIYQNYYVQDDLKYLFIYGQSL